MQYQTLNAHKSVNQFEKVTRLEPCDKLKILQNTPIYPDGISWPLKMGNQIFALGEP